MRRALALLFLALATTAHGASVEVCYNYGCATSATIALNDADLAELDALFEGNEAPLAERVSIGMAIGLMNRIAGRQTPIHNDQPENNDEGVDGRMDCIDHSTSATRYLTFLAKRGLLQFHRVLEPLHRAPYLINDHWGARIIDTQDDRQYIVDAWFYANGHDADVLPAETWLRGAGGR